MATPITIQHTQVKQQSLWGVLGLTLITIGIYVLFWYYRVNREMRDVGQAYGDTELAKVSPGLAVLALFVPIVNLVSFHRTGRRVQAVQRVTGTGGNYSMLVHWLLLVFTGLWHLYTQFELNGVWTRAGQQPSGTVAVDGGAGSPFVETR